MWQTAAALEIYFISGMEIMMSQLKCDFKVVGPVQTNCYFLSNTDTRECVIVDPGEEAGKIADFIEKKELKPVAILLTHGHFDHIGAVADLVDRTGCEVYIHIMDKPKLTDDAGMLANLFRIRGHRNYTGKVNVFTEDDILKLDELEFDVLETPGHTSGSVCFICGMNMFSGDTLFSRSVGRTDMPDGSSPALMKSLMKIADLGGNLTVYPGHMNVTTLDAERKYNPYLRQAAEALK